MPDPSPTCLSACDEDLPLLPITRQFDFGQFLMLRQSGDQQDKKRARFQQTDRAIVVDPSGGYVQAYQDWLERTQQASLDQPPLSPRSRDAAVPFVGVSLTKILKGAPAGGSDPAEIPVGPNELEDLLEKGEIQHDGQALTVSLDPQSRARLAAGYPTLVIANTPKDDRWIMTQLAPKVETRTLAPEDIDHLIAKQQLKVNGTFRSLELSAAATGALLDSQPTLVALGDGSGGFVRLVPQQPESRPAATAMHVTDLAGFLAHPAIPGAVGELIPVSLKPSDVSKLRRQDAVTVVVGKTPVTLYSSAREVGSSSYAQVSRESEGGLGLGDDEGGSKSSDGDTHRATPEGSNQPVQPVGGSTPGTTTTTGTGTPSTKSPPPPPPGQGWPAADPKPMATALQVAVFMPWRQTWRMTGFSRGELRRSLALAPQEETTIEVSNWQRRARSLDQSSSTEVEQSFESTDTERETDDVFKELTSRHDFNWQIDGSVDATYNSAWGSVHVTAGGGVADAQQLQQIARNTQQRMKESTQKSAAKVRTMRSTRIMDAVEVGSQDRVTRRIRNPNFSHTLTLDFFETLVHYEVTLEPVPDRLELVALIPNPLATNDFTADLVRRNESALRRALLDPALDDGFEACRKIQAYAHANRLVAEQAAASKQSDDATRKEGSEKKDTGSKPTPQETEVVQLLTQIAAAAKQTRNTSIVPALSKINDDVPSNPVTDVERRNAQYWLFRHMLAKYLPSVLKAMDDLPASPTIDDAQAFISVLPDPGSAVTIGNLNERSDRDKEESGLGAEIARTVGAGFKWAWSTGRCREEGLYTVNDAGIAGLSTELQRAYVEWRAKRAEGELKEETEVTIAKANAQQDKLSTEDRLAMAFPLDELSSAFERREALLAHLNEHKEHYSFALFQALSPAEQNMYIERASGGRLEVGMFEPRVVAINGPDLAVPLSPPPAGELRTMLEDLRTSFAGAFAGTADRPDTFIFPTPGLTISSRLGKCTATEEFIEESRKIELRRLAAEADSARHEASRRAARIEAGNLEDPDIEAAPLRVRIDNHV